MVRNSQQLWLPAQVQTQGDTVASAQRLQDLHAALTFAFPFLFYLILGNLAGFYSVLFPVNELPQ